MSLLLACSSSEDWSIAVMVVAFFAFIMLALWLASRD